MDCVPDLAAELQPGHKRQATASFTKKASGNPMSDSFFMMEFACDAKNH